MEYIYARVSTKKQDTKPQIAELKKKYKFAQVIQETKSSRKVRPKLRDLLDMVLEGDTIIVWKFDRISRTMLELQNMCEDLRARGVNLISFTQDIDMSTLTGKIMLLLLGMFAEMERDNISERTTIGLKNKKEEARLAGRLFKKSEREGYKFHKKGGQTPVPRSKKMLFRLSELKDLGFTWDRIAEKLAYENSEWKISAKTAYRISVRMYAGTQ